MTILSREAPRVTTRSPAETERLGRALGASLHSGDLICLSGELGAGKTALAAGIGRGWGALEPVNSPTFVFIHEHRRAADTLRLYHVDAYRLSGPDDAATLGLEDLLMSEHILMIEWPERIAELLPAERLWITLEPLEDESARFITLEASGARSAALRRDVLQAFREGA